MELTMGSGTDDDPLAAALGRIPSGLFILTARHGGHETGMLASWVQQCSFDPPQLTAALRKGRDVLAWLTEGAEFTVNVIPEGGKALVAHLGKVLSWINQHLKGWKFDETMERRRFC
jgi:flavin reductase (DIM6/NTAB) family NADH-FMN oxidoreductase RutF